LSPASIRAARNSDAGGAITKSGNGRVRRILVEAAWACRHYPKVTMRQRKMLTHQPPIVADVCRKANLRLTKRFHRLEARGNDHPSRSPRLPATSPDSSGRCTCRLGLTDHNTQNKPRTCE
jgi:hypothetical protein